MADNKTQIVISADDQASSVIGKISGGLGSLGNAANTLAPVLSRLTGVLTVSGLATMAKSAIDAGDELNKLSQKTGITVEQLSALKYAGELSDVPLESLAQGLKKLSVNMVDVADGAKGETADAFKEIGVRVTESTGAMRSSDAVMLDIAEKFAGMQDGAEKTALAVKLFGKSGADLIPYLNQGASGISDLRQEAERLGIIVGTDFARDSEKFNDALTKMSKNSTALGIAITKDLIGPAANFLELMNKVGTGGAIFATLDRSINRGDINKRIEELQKQADEANKNFMDGSKYNPMTTVWGARAVALEQQLSGLKVMAEELDKAAAAVGPPASAAGGRTRTPKSGGSKSTGGKSDLQRMLEIGQKNELEAYYATAGEETMREVAEKQSIKSAQAAQKEAEQMERLAEKYRDMADPLQKYRVELDTIQKLRDSGALTADQALAAEWSVNEALDAQAEKMNGINSAIKETDNFARDMGMTFSSAFEDAIVGGKSLSDVLKGLAQDVERIFVRKTLTEPMGNALASAFNGLWSGDSIGSTSSGGDISAWAYDALMGKGLSGFATGGSFMVGGSGGTDSQLVAFRATPNERVTIETPNQQAASGASSIRVEIVNQTSTPSRVAQVQPSFDPAGMVMRIFLTDLRDNGPLRQGMAAAGIRGA